ncbi:hypothetical protein G6011_11693 [Alternaria panax]|uniref:Uncharacterized protein n=1 Tax=Alternaria panax TaxID=48097 RepID=A0AAD4IEB9_9PLEO|nr:hypothetical protein G6011_11693 [Alternaria panax]
MSDQNNQQKGFFGTAASGLGNTLGAATNTVGKGVQGVTDATGNVVAAGGKGLGDAVTGVTRGVGDTTKAAGSFVGDTTKAGDFYVTSMQFIKNAHQDAYPAVDPSSPEHSLAEKVAVITGASRSIGAMTLTYALDISDRKAVEGAFEAIRQEFGHADVLINATDAMTGDGPKLHDTDPDQWWRNFVRSDPLLIPQ